MSTPGQWRVCYYEIVEGSSNLVLSKEIKYFSSEQDANIFCEKIRVPVLIGPEFVTVFDMIQES